MIDIVFPTPINPICDFCNEKTDPDTRRSYAASDFVYKQVGDTTLASKGDWCACPVCARFIDTKRWNALLEYSLASFQINNPSLAATIPEDTLRDSIGQLHRQFRESRT